MYGDSNVFSTRITYVNVHIGRQFIFILTVPFAILMTKCFGSNGTQGCYISAHRQLNCSQ